VFAQEVQLLLCLHTFRHHLQIEVVRHGDNGGRDGHVVAVGRNVAHEGAVDLEAVEG